MNGHVSRGWSNDAATGTNPCARLIERDGFRPRWLAPDALSTIQEKSTGICWRLDLVRAALDGDALADLAWLDAEGYSIRVRARQRRRDGAAVLHVTIRPGVSTVG